MTKKVVADSLTYDQARAICDRCPDLRIGYLLRDEDEWAVTRQLVDELAKGKSPDDPRSGREPLMPKKPAPRPARPRLLAGGNPQIAKADGDAPVQAYIKAIPGWKRELANRLDAVITRAFPKVRKAVRWNSPFYGVEGGTWFLSFHCFTKYVKVTFFSGASLEPLPPGESKMKNVRHFDIHEGDELDEKRFASWVKQAARLPGWGKV